MTKKWGVPNLDAAQFATDRFFEAQAQITNEVGEIMERKRLGTATPEDGDRLKKA